MQKKIKIKLCIHNYKAPCFLPIYFMEIINNSAIY